MKKPGLNRYYIQQRKLQRRLTSRRPADLNAEWDQEFHLLVPSKSVKRSASKQKLY